MKKLFGIALVLCMLLPMAACLAETAPVTITFWHTYGDTETPYFENEIIPAFEATHPGIKVEAVRQEGGSFNQMLVTAFGTGVVPDVARVDITKTSAYAQLGGIVALDEMPGFAGLKAAMLEGPMSTNLYNGKYYGLPLNTNCKAAVMNKAILESLGFEAAPETMEAFIAACREKVPGEYKINVSGVGDWDLYPYFWLFGGVLTDDGFRKATGYLDGEASVKALETMKALHDEKIFSIRDVDGTQDAWAGINDEYAMFFEGPWFPFAEGIEPSLIPTYEGRSASVVGGENIVMFEGSTKKEAAWEFVQYMLTEEVQLKLLTVGVIPTLKACVDSQQVQSDPKWSVYMQQLQSAKSRIPSPNASNIEQIWSDAMNMIFVEEADIQVALNEAAKLIDLELTK